MLSRIIAHVDMDYFFAAVEERDKPGIKGKPVIVGADPKRGRGVVSTCNYRARKYGVRSGMPISEAYRLCPHAIFLPVRIDRYRDVSEKIMNILKGYGTCERWGLDEAFIDISNRVKNYEEAKRLGKEIKKKIRDAVGLTCSVGIGPNKLVAKIASGFRKPDGLTIVKPDEVEHFLSPLPVRSLLWIGEKTARRLLRIGVKTVGDLANANVDKLYDEFGEWGYRMRLWAKGVDESEVSDEYIRKSLGVEITFPKDVREEEAVMKAVDKLCDEIIEGLYKEDLFFKNVTVKVRYEDFETHTKSRTLERYTNEKEILRRTAGELARFFLKGKRIRLVGVRVSSLLKLSGQKRIPEFID